MIKSRWLTEPQLSLLCWLKNHPDPTLSAFRRDIYPDRPEDKESQPKLALREANRKQFLDRLRKRGFIEVDESLDKLSITQKGREAIVKASS